MEQRVYRILLDGSWSLEDLMNFSRVYFQNYSFIYCLESSEIDVANRSISAVLEQYELRDGLSYVNIYDIFRSHISKKDRPQIKSIQYASPGWIDLALNYDVALNFAKVLGIYLGAPVSVAITYKKLHEIYINLDKKRKENRISTLKLDQQQAKEAQKLCKELAAGLGFSSLAELDKHTKDIEESSKLLMAHYRRMKKIADFVESGKASFPRELHDED